MAEEHVDARRAALLELFDDAAVFPPASREVADALAAHRDHVRGERAWLVRRVLTRASQIDAFVDALSEDDDLRVGVVLDGHEADAFTDRVQQDLKRAESLADDKRVRVTGIEVPLAGRDPDAELAGLLAGLRATPLPSEAVVAVEVPVAGRAAGEVLRGLKAIVTAKAAGGRDADRLLGKVRCGGQTPTAIPEDVELAGFLRACAREQLPFKATAGLHHPTRRTNAEHGGLEHGFLNLLAAAAAAYQGARLEVIEGHLARSPEQFRLGPGALVVGEDVIEGTILAEVRRDFFHGIGCCDISDPVGDLASLGVLTAAGGLA